jgi:hypothetical protein
MENIPLTITDEREYEEIHNARTAHRIRSPGVSVVICRK